LGAALVAAMTFAGAGLAAAEGVMEFTIIGELTKAEDAGYPMYVLAIKPAGEAQQEFLLNNEEAKVDGQIEQMVGKAVEAEVRIAPSVDIVDLMFGGKTVIWQDGQGREAGETTKMIAGKLSGAAEPTAGDLPSELAVTAPDGTKVTFEWFVTPEMVEFNGKNVEFYYEDGTTADVLAIKVIE